MISPMRYSIWWSNCDCSTREFARMTLSESTSCYRQIPRPGCHVMTSLLLRMVVWSFVVLMTWRRVDVGSVLEGVGELVVWGAM